MTIRKWINAVKLPTDDKSGRPKINTSIPSMMIYDLLIIMKNSLIIQDVENRKRALRPEVEVYHVNCVEMEIVDHNECPCTPKRGCTWMKSKEHLPDRYGMKLEEVRFPGGRSNEIAFMDLSDYVDKSSSRFSLVNDRSTYTIKNDGGREYLYGEFPLGQTPKFLQIDIAALDPLDLRRFMCEDKNPVCDFLGQEFDIDPRYADVILTKVTEQIATKMRLSAVSDFDYDKIDKSQA